MLYMHNAFWLNLSLDFSLQVHTEMNVYSVCCGIKVSDMTAYNVDVTDNLICVKQKGNVVSNI